MAENPGKSLQRRLESLRAAGIKKEPISVPEPSEEYEQNEHRFHRDTPYHDFRTAIPPPPQLSTSVNYEPIREQFLNKTLTADHIIQRVQERGIVPRHIRRDSQMDSVYNRAQDIQNRLRGQQDDQNYYARMPIDIDESRILPNNSSPLVQSNNYSLYSFQAHEGNVRNVMVENNPYHLIPFQVRNVSSRIGANLEKINEAILDSEGKKRKPDKAATASINEHEINNETDESTSKESVRKEVREETSRKKLVENSTQTTENTGDLHFFITSNELKDLSEKKKKILLEFMDVSLAKLIYRRLD